MKQIPPPASSSCPKVGKLSVLDRASRLVGELLPKALRPVLTSACALVALTFGVAGQANAQAPGGAQPALVSIDLKGSNHYRCKDNTGTLLPSTEFAAPAGQQLAQFVASAAKMGSTVDADITYANPGTVPVTSTTVRTIYNGVQWGPTRTITFSPPLAPGTSRTVGTQIGPLPNRIDDGTALILTGTTGIPLKLYLTYDAPHGEMSNPWVGVLARACAWARNSTTYTQTVDTIGQTFFDVEPISYNGGQAPNYFNYVDNSFNLGRYLVDTGRLGDCVDVACITSLIYNSVGIASNPRAFWDSRSVSPSAPTMIITWPICSIGSARLNPDNYSPWEWNFHCHVKLPTGTVVDTCAAQIKDCTLGWYYWNIPLQWLSTPYWQNQGLNPYAGLVFSELTYPAQTTPQPSTASTFFELTNFQVVSIL